MILTDVTDNLYHYRAEVISHGDGDTFRVRMFLGDDVERLRSIRVFGLKCPETRTKDPEEKARGLQSAAFTARLMPIGSTVYLKTYKDSKSADRLVCVVYFPDADGTTLFNLGERVVSQGYGEWDPRWVKTSSHTATHVA